MTARQLEIDRTANPGADSGGCETCGRVDVPLTRKGHLAHHGAPSFPFPQEFHGGCCWGSGEVPVEAVADV